MNLVTKTIGFFASLVTPGGRGVRRITKNIQGFETIKRDLMDGHALVAEQMRRNAEQAIKLEQAQEALKEEAARARRWVKFLDAPEA